MSRDSEMQAIAQAYDPECECEFCECETGCDKCEGTGITYLCRSCAEFYEEYECDEDI